MSTKAGPNIQFKIDSAVTEEDESLSSSDDDSMEVSNRR